MRPGAVLRLRSPRTPIDDKAIERIVAARPALHAYVGADRMRDLGRDIGLEIVDGGKTPLLDALGDVLLQERDGDSQPPADGVVVNRAAPPQRGLTHEFRLGLYGGLADAGVPAVGVERSAPAASAITAFSLSGLSTVDSVETWSGRLALVLELAGAGRATSGSTRARRAGCCHPWRRSR